MPKPTIKAASIEELIDEIDKGNAKVTIKHILKMVEDEGITVHIETDRYVYHLSADPLDNTSATIEAMDKEDNATSDKKKIKKIKDGPESIQEDVKTKIK